MTHQILPEMTMTIPINDSHAIPDEPDHLAAFLAQHPIPGDLFVDRENQPYFVVDDDGRSVVMNAVGEWCDPASVCEFDGPLTRAQIVPADAIMLPALTTEATLALAEGLDGADLSSAVNSAIGTYGDPTVYLSLPCLDHPYYLSPAQARTFAARLALAAADAETPGTGA